jgi:hypothetical protein
MHRRPMLRLATPPAPKRGAKVVCLDARRKARLERLAANRPLRPDAA